ncbi:MAG: universal stress protein [Haloglomus sp.]
MTTYEALLALDSSESRASAQADAIADLPAAADAVHATLVYVFTEPHDIEARQIGSVRRAAERLEEANVETTLTTRVGDPADEIVALASELDANLICLGEWKRSTIDEVLHGSVTRTVVHRTTRPTLICYAPADDS